MRRLLILIISFFLVKSLFLLNPIMNQAAHAQDSSMRIHFINVGYGDAILVQLPDQSTMLIDAGYQEHSADLVRYLESVGVQKINTAIITHPHKNHFEGFAAVLDHWVIDRLFINGDTEGEEGYGALLGNFKQKDVPVATLKKREELMNLPEGVKLTALNPDRLNASLNGNSLATFLQFQNKTILLLADIEPIQQEKLILAFPEVKSADIIQLPHHGKDLSPLLSDTFIDRTFVISTGPNKYGMPDPEELNRFSGRILRTDEVGSIIIEIQNGDVIVTTEHETK